MKRILFIFTSSLAVALLAGCTMYDTPPPVEGKMPDDKLSLKVQKKVLWINLDGGVGSVVAQAATPTLTAMLENSKYSWEGLSENRELAATQANREDPVNWSSMLTGVSMTKHNIKGRSYLPDIDVDPANPDAKVTFFPTIVHYITQANPNSRCYCITPWEDLNINMLGGSYATVTSGSDAHAYELASGFIRDEDPTFMLVSFRGLLDAGAQGGFTSSNSGYISALNTIDGYIGGLLEQIGERENAYFEDWLVIVSSGYGGNPGGDYLTSTDESRNTFGLFYFPKYAKKRMNGNLFYAAYFPQTTQGVAADAENPVYSPYTNTQFTLEFIMRMNPKADGTYGNGAAYPCMIGKSGKWGVYRQHGNAYSRFQYDGNAIQKNISSFNDFGWHTYSLNIDKSQSPTGDITYAIDYDGVPVSVRTSIGQKVITTIQDTVNFVVNYEPGKIATTWYLSEIRMWKTTFPQTVVYSNASAQNIDSTHPYYNDLLGYWRFIPETYDVDTRTFRNEVPGRSGMVMNEPMKFVRFANTLPAYKASGDLIIENTMFAPQIMYWLGVTPPSTLDSPVFLNNYASAEEWREE